MASSCTVDHLPDDVLLDIFSYVSKEDLVCSLQNVSARWRELVQDTRLWRNYTFYFPAYKTKKVVSLLKKMPRLKSFAFNADMNVNQVVDALCQYCKEVKSLNSCEVPGLVPKHWNSLIRHLPDIECLHVHPASLALEPHLLCQFSKLKKLKSTGTVPNHYHAFAGEGNGCQNLEEFEIASPKLGFCVTEHVISNNKENLLSLNLYGVQDSVFEIVPQCQRLKSLTLNFSSEICTTFRSTLPLLGKLKNLKILCLRNFVDDNNDILCQLFAGGHLSSLVELDLSYCRNFSERVASNIAQCCPRLEVLNLMACVCVDDACVAKLARCQQLQVLNLAGCTRVTENGLVTVGQLRKLHTLYLPWIVVVSRAAVDALSASTSLRKLDLNANRIEEQEVYEMIQRMPSLKYLNAYHWRDTDATKIQDNLRSVRITCARLYSPSPCC